MVEIDGERTLAASCIREARAGMVVRSASSERAGAARAMVVELLAADMPPEAHNPDVSSHFMAMAELLAVDVGHARETLGGARETVREWLGDTVEEWLPTPASALDHSHAAMAVNHDACISCGLCVRACREVQVNDVIGLAGRGSNTRIVFDLEDPMGDSTCVACGECVQACPTGALMPAAQVDEQGHGDSAAVDARVASVCPYCGVGCQLEYQVSRGSGEALSVEGQQAATLADVRQLSAPSDAITREATSHRQPVADARLDNIIAVSGRDGPSNHGRLCVKGRFGFDYPRHPERLIRPLIRRDGVAKGLDANFDPAHPLTHFREASWDEALEVAAEGLMRLKRTHGPDSLAGFGSAKCTNEEAWLFQKLVRTGFGSNHVDHCTRLCHASSVAALMEGVGSGGVSASFMQAEQSDLIVLTGCNPGVNHPVAATFFKRAARRGTRIVVIDPRALALRRHAHRSIQFTPGADVALFNAMLNVIITEGLANQAYIEAHTEDFAALAEHVTALTPEAMSPLCGVAAEEIRAVAREYAMAERAMIFWGMGISQHTHGTDNARCLIALALVCGHVGREGTGLHPLRGQNNVQGASDAGMIPMVFPDYQPVGDTAARARLEALWDTPLSATPGLTVVEIMHAIHADQIRGMYILGENPAMSDPDLDHARSALAHLEHLVVQDIFVTETAQFADVVLPSYAWPEKDGSVTNTNRQVQRGRAALRAPGEAKPDWWITQQLARRMGLAWDYAGPQEIYAEMQQGMDSLDNIDWARLSEENSVTYPCLTPGGEGEDVVFGDGFPRASGRARFVPTWPTPPDETLDDDYPTVLTTGRQLEHWHTGSMTRRAYVLDSLEPAAVATLNPVELERLGITAGEALSITTRRGQITLATRADPLTPAGMVFVPFCYAEAAANLLTNPALDPVGKIPEFKYAACRLARAESASASLDM
ncbi:formate dehydrogenase subunit alpha [Cobetia marina]|nr:formate dehydrogenase subunit alpha [Cobetia marina]